MTNGFAAGFWASSISDKSYPGAASNSICTQLRHAFNDDWSWRAGLYGYVYRTAISTKLASRRDRSTRSRRMRR
jgi:hypothetical protein